MVSAPLAFHTLYWILEGNHVCRLLSQQGGEQAQACRPFLVWVSSFP